MTTEKVLQGLAIPQDNKVLTQREIIDEIYIVSKNMDFSDSDLLVNLAEHESAVMKYPKILDVNNKYSYGLYHFQRATFDYLCVGKYQLPDDIMDVRVQTECSIDAIRDGLANQMWFNSMNKIRNGK